MSHHVYTTRGLVLRLRPLRESDRQAALLTRDLGLVHGTARGARSLVSKLSPTLLPLSLVKISLVKGRHSWRITTVTLLRDLTTELRERKEALRALARVASLVEKLVHGEEKNAELYESLERSASVLIDEIGDEDIGVWELYTVARVLYCLGYLSKNSLPSNITEARKHKKSLVTLINSGIRESGLQ